MRSFDTEDIICRDDNVVEVDEERIVDECFVTPEVDTVAGHIDECMQEHG